MTDDLNLFPAGEVQGQVPPPPRDIDTSRDGRPIDTLRPRRIYLRPAGGFVGFGRNPVEQPDLYEAEYRIGWRILVVCRVCLTAELNTLRAELARVKRWAGIARDNAAGAIEIMETKKGPPS